MYDLLPVQIASHMELAADIEEDTTGKYPLYIPDGNGDRKVHVWCEQDKWSDAYMDLTDRITDSKKLNDADKTARLKQLSDVNRDILEQM